MDRSEIGPICRICARRGKEVPATHYSDAFPDARWYICDRHAEIWYTWAFGPIAPLSTPEPARKGTRTNATNR